VSEASDAALKTPEVHPKITLEEPKLSESTLAPTRVSKDLRVCLMVEPCPLTYVSGYANRFQELLKHLAAEKDSVEIVSVQLLNPKERPKTFLGFPVHYTGGFQMPNYPKLSISFDWTFKLLRTVLHMRPNLIHVSSPGFMLFGAVFCARALQIPLIISYHTHLPVYVRSYGPRFLGTNRFCEWLSWQLLRMLHSCADQTVVTSPQIRDEFVAHGVPRVGVWQKGIDSQRFHPRFRDGKMRELMTGGNSNDFLLTYIGRVASEKRIKDIKAMLARMPPDTRLCIVGGGPSLDELKEFFAGTNTVFTGMLSGTELSQAFASADLFVMPSDSETLGFVVLESMASGIPVVGAAAGGVQDLIHHEQTGFLCPTNDTDEFCRRILQLRNDRSLRQRLGAQARAETERWTWNDSMAKMKNEHYEAALQHFSKRWERRLGRFLTFQWGKK